jgi:hypothetical protein
LKGIKLMDENNKWDLIRSDIKNMWNESERLYNEGSFEDSKRLRMQVDILRERLRQADVVVDKTQASIKLFIL